MSLNANQQALENQINSVLNNFSASKADLVALVASAASASANLNAAGCSLLKAKMDAVHDAVVAINTAMTAVPSADLNSALNGDDQFANVT